MRIPRSVAANAGRVVGLTLALGLLGVIPCAAADCAAAGTWNLRVEWPQRTAEVRLDVASGEEITTVRWTGPQGELSGREARCEAESLAFELEVETSEGVPASLRFEGRVEGGRLEGTLRLPNGSEVAIDGKRTGSGGA